MEMRRRSRRSSRKLTKKLRARRVRRKSSRMLTLTVPCIRRYLITMRDIVRFSKKGSGIKNSKRVNSKHSRFFLKKSKTLWLSSLLEEVNP